MLPKVCFKFNKEYFGCSSTLFHMCYKQCQKSYAVFEEERCDTPAPPAPQSKIDHIGRRTTVNKMTEIPCWCLGQLTETQWWKDLIQLQGSHVPEAVYHFSVWMKWNEMQYFDLSWCWAMLLLCDIEIVFGDICCFIVEAFPGTKWESLFFLRQALNSVGKIYLVITIE